METHCPWDDIVTEVAAGKGRLDMLQLLTEQGAPRSTNTCTEAARGGHLQCLVYAHEQNYAWSATTCGAAGRNGHCECLQYAHQKRLPVGR